MLFKFFHLSQYVPFIETTKFFCFISLLGSIIYLDLEQFFETKLLSLEITDDLHYKLTPNLDWSNTSFLDLGNNFGQKYGHSNSVLMAPGSTPFAGITLLMMLILITE